MPFPLKINSSIGKLMSFFGGVLILLMLLIPFGYQHIKLIIISCLLGLCIYKICLFHKIIRKDHIIWIFVYTAINLFYLLYGIIRGNPAPMLYFPTFILWPILYFVLAQFVTVGFFYFMIKLMKYSAFCIAIIGIFAFIYFNITLSTEKLILDFESSIRPGFPLLAISGAAITSFSFVYFYLFSLYCLNNKNSIFDLINLILGFFFILFTSRRALYLNFLLSIFFIFCFLFFTRKQDRILWQKKLIKLFIVVSFIIILVFIWIFAENIIQLDDLIEFFMSAFGDGDPSDPRIAQSHSLIQGWKDNVLFGNAPGVNASVVRSINPGTYELTYHAMLFERGLVGVTIYALQYILLNVWCIKSFYKSNVPLKYIISYLVSLNLFMLANASNPYLGAFDHMWYLFLAFVFLNQNILNKNNENMCINPGL